MNSSDLSLTARRLAAKWIVEGYSSDDLWIVGTLAKLLPLSFAASIRAGVGWMASSQLVADAIIGVLFVVAILYFAWQAVRASFDVSINLCSLCRRAPWAVFSIIFLVSLSVLLFFIVSLSSVDFPEQHLAVQQTLLVIVGVCVNVFFRIGAFFMRQIPMG
jgi:hypothetical protein